MENYLKNSTFLLIIITLLYAVLTGIKLTERKRVMLVYIFAYALALAGAFQIRVVFLSSTLVLFLALEFFTDDSLRPTLFVKFRYKLSDFLYRMFMEYAYSYFLLCMLSVFLTHVLNGPFVLRAISQLIAFLFLGIALHVLASQKYSTKSITSVIKRIEGDKLPHELKVTSKDRALNAILVGMEDRTYYERQPQQHSLPLFLVVGKVWNYLFHSASHNVISSFRSLFVRGYGTIEMQLIRSIGIEFGYGRTYRRKVFEVLYANMLLNSYREYLIRAHGDYHEFRNYILRKYIENVDSSVNGNLFRPDGRRSSLLRMFKKNRMSDITKEEFFIWCLGLPQRDYIHETVLDFYSPFMQRFNISRIEVQKILRTFQ